MSVKKTMNENGLSQTPASGDNPFKNQLLVAMPNLQLGAFARSVIYVCAYSSVGAMGIVVNQKMPEVRFGDLLTQLNLTRSEKAAEKVADPIVHFGGPVETGRGFVLHSIDFIREDTVRINDRIGITGTVDVLSAIAEGSGPHKSIFALGYAGWGPGQLDAEIQANSWLTVPADEDIVFGADLSCKWEKALLKIGVTPAGLSLDAGHA